MQVVIRADASTQIGTGHVMRCLTLADRFRRNGAIVQFICREHPGHLCDLIQQKGFTVFGLPTSVQKSNPVNGNNPYEYWLGETWETDLAQTSDILRRTDGFTDLLVIDHYAIDIKWEQRVRKFVNKIMIIDDLANRPHDCDILLDQNLYRNMETRYDGRIPNSCLKLLGPRYALLREEFQVARRHPKTRVRSVKRIFVFFGGSDPTNETEKVLKGIALLDLKNVWFDVVVGSSNLNKEKIAALCSKMHNTEFYCQIDYIAELMEKADLAIGAGGTTTWERCSLGLPSITVTTADNQIEVTEAVSREGAIYYLGHYSNVSPQLIAEAIDRFLKSPELLTTMGNSGMLLMGDCQATGADNVADILMT